MLSVGFLGDTGGYVHPHTELRLQCVHRIMFVYRSEQDGTCTSGLKARPAVVLALLPIQTPQRSCTPDQGNQHPGIEPRHW